MLNKEVCRKCIDRNRQKQLGILSNPWNSIDEDNWKNGTVYCPFVKTWEFYVVSGANLDSCKVGRNLSSPKNKAIIPECPYKLEHVVIRQKHGK